MQVQFVNHFSGCQMCLDLNKNGDMPECEREYIKSFEYANSVMMKLLARKPPRNVSMHESILASFYCQVPSAAMHVHSATNLSNLANQAAAMGENTSGTAILLLVPDLNLAHIGLSSHASIGHACNICHSYLQSRCICCHKDPSESQRIYRCLF